MAYTISHSAKHGIIELVLAGSIDEAQVRQYTERFAMLRQQYGCDRLLVDGTAQVTAPTVMETYQRHDHYEQLRLPRTVRVALLLPNAKAARQAMLWWETLSANRGWGVARICADRDEAMSWLQSAA